MKALKSLQEGGQEGGGLLQDLEDVGTREAEELGEGNGRDCIGCEAATLG